MPTYQMIKVFPGEFNERFVQVHGAGGHNRDVNPARARKMADTWEAAKRDTVTLILDGDQYRIADGQHRIFCASEVIRNPKGEEFHAMVWGKNEITDVREFIESLNRGVPLTLTNLLQVYQTASPWPGIARAVEDGVVPVFKRISNRRGDFAWAAVMQGMAISDYWLKRGRVVVHRPNRHELVRDYWLEVDEKEARRVLVALRWWHPVATSAFELRSKAAEGFNAASVAFAITMWRLHKNKAGLHKVRDRLITSGRLSQIKGLEFRSVKDMAEIYLGGMNYRASTQFIDLFGSTGRED